jgi:hypothetical protein
MMLYVVLCKDIIEKIALVNIFVLISIQHQHNGYSLYVQRKLNYNVICFYRSEEDANISCRLIYSRSSDGQSDCTPGVEALKASNSDKAPLILEIMG